MSYAVETTLRSAAAIEQAKRARAAGFETVLIFVATSDPAENQRRVALRGHAGGHAATPAEISDIYKRSLLNLPLAVEVFERIDLWDNSRFGGEPTIIAECVRQRWRRFVDSLPDWARAVVVD